MLINQPTNRSTNRLIHEQSPYLLQHAHNPVDWFAWGPDAFDQARRENKPIFLSIGYATCHWCHVMAHESFEDPEVALALNQHFIAVKVDREERPDIDAIYMAACQLATGSGGWPLTIIMTPDKKPFFAGTYLPKTSRFGRMGLLEICSQTTALWHNSSERVAASAQEIITHLGHFFSFETVSENSSSDPLELNQKVLDQAAAQICRGYDAQFGGFDTAPKFPMPHRLMFLLGQHERSGDAAGLNMVRHTLTAMRMGGLWDHVGFGFHRYATDRQWLLPHFEKMLYDQALLAQAYLRAFEMTADPLMGRTAEDIFTYVLRDMTDPLGGFYTAEDADSEGEEGKYYLWSIDEFDQVVQAGQAAIPWSALFNLQPEGNFIEEAGRKKTGTNILHLTRSMEEWAVTSGISPDGLTARWQDVRRLLFAQRLKRVPPLKDDKVLTDWNGLMIAALASGARVLNQPRLVAAAEKSALFVLERMRDPQGRLLHRFRQGQAAIPATANDHAFLIMGLLALFKTTQKTEWKSYAIEFQQAMSDLFWDQEQGGFFLTAQDQLDLPVRPKELYDGAMPSANSVALNNLAILAEVSGQRRWADQAGQLLKAFADTVSRRPTGYTHLLDGWDRLQRWISV